MQPVRVRSLVIGILAIAPLLAAPSAGVGAEAPTLRSTQPPYFTADLSIGVDSTGHPSVGVSITLPYTELSWNRTRTGYAAGAGFAVELQPEHGDRLYGDSWEQRLLMDSYAATRNHRNNLVVTRTFDAPAGHYRARVSVSDLSAESRSQASDGLVVEDLSRVPTGFGDLALGVLDSTGTFTAIPTRRFGFNVADLAARVTLFDRRPGDWPRRITFHWRILDDTGAESTQADTALTLQRSAEPVVLRTPGSNLFLGTYTLQIERVEGKARWRTSRTFAVEESGPPRGKAFDQLLEALAYIASPAEIDGMRHLSADEQAAAWDRFWRRRDPTPDTPANEFQIEFFRRLRYAEQHFQGFGPGWRSDMGHVYVRYGPPDQVEQVAASATNAGREIWYYNQPYHRFVFEDRDGFGRFTLLNPLSE